MDDLIDRALKATVKVKFTSQHDVWTSIVIGETSDFTLVLTIAHALNNDGEIPPMEVIFSDISEAFPAVSVICNRDADILILRIGKVKENKSRRVDFASGAEKCLTYGQKLFGFSHPDQREWSYSRGIIMHPGSKNDTRMFGANIIFFDHDMDFFTGSSGAGILNKDGKLVGMQCLLSGLVCNVPVFDNQTRTIRKISIICFDMAVDLKSNSVVGWIYMDGNIRQTQLDGCIYDKSVSKHVKLDLGMKFHDLFDVLCLKLKIDRSKYGLKLFYRCKNPDDLKFGIVPIEDDDDVELMFGVVVSKGAPFFVELYLEKNLVALEGGACELIESSKVGEMKTTGVLHGTMGSSTNMDGETSSSRLVEVNEFVESGTSNEKSVDKSSGNTKIIGSFDEFVLRTERDMLSPIELRKGMIFGSKEELAHTIKQIHIRNHQEIVVTRSDQINWHVICKWKDDGCEWSLKARKRSAHGYFEIMETSGPHTCMNTTITQDHPNLKCSDIVEAIKSQIVADPTIKEKVLLATAENVFGYHPGRKKIRNARKHAMDEVYGSWEGSYEDLPHLMEALQSFNVGTKVDWFFKDDEFEERVCLKVMTFKRVFWAFKPCIDGFEHCIPVIQIDGTHLYGPYPGVLLSATAVDGFSHIFPLAFAIVESENLSSWNWFMERLRRFVVPRRHGICIISDRHAGIVASMQNPGWCEPHDYHRFCVRHLAANFASAHNKKGLRDRVVQLASQVQPKKFDLLWDQLMAIEPRTAEWFANKPLMKWSLAHDGGKRFGMMTINHAESWNNAIFDARKLPVTSLVRELFCKTVEYFDQRRLEVATQSVNGQLFTKFANKMLSRAISRASGHHIKLFDRETWLFQVVTKKVGLKGGNSHTVRIQESMCTCGKWQNYRIPCSHLIACCAHVKMKHEMFVGEWYKLDNVSKVYGGKFEPIPFKGDPRWPMAADFPKVIHDNDIIKKKGRRKSTRFKNEMDFQAPRAKKATSSIIS